jgi:hypothetical protein
MRVLVCGGRDFNNHVLLHRTLADLKPTFIVNGGQRGADALSSMWAHWLDIPYREYPADWRNFGTAAGPIRNQQMLTAEKPDVVVAFPGGRGTASMVALAKKAGVRVIEVEEATEVKTDE